VGKSLIEKKAGNNSQEKVLKASTDKVVMPVLEFKFFESIHILLPFEVKFVPVKLFNLRCFSFIHNIAKTMLVHTISPHAP
jgi:hypothetical protein